MRILRSLKLMLIPALIVSCAVRSPDLVPCMCDGTEKTLGLFNCMCEPGRKKPVKRVAYIQNEEMVNPSADQMNAYGYLHRSRSNYAPVKLEYVDFRIPKGRKYEGYSDKLGNYRFRIFGCRRFDKNVYLNQGRAMQKDMKFFDIFFETMNDNYPVVVEKSNPYYMYSDKAQAEYILTAEITDYFMNVCDEFDWNNVKKQNLRTGTSEMTVTWRLLDLTKDKVYCKGTTTGYGEMKDGEYKGETLLVERAFGDALSKLPEVGCFNTELAKRVKPEEIEKQLAKVEAIEKSKVNFKNQYEAELNGVNMLQSCGSGEINPKENADSFSQVVATAPVAGRYEVSGYIDESGNVIVLGTENTAGLCSVGGEIITGYISEDGKFVQSATGKEYNITGAINNMCKLTETREIKENGGFYAYLNNIDGNGGTSGTGMNVAAKVRGYIDESGSFVALAGDSNCGINANIITGKINKAGKFVEDNTNKEYPVSTVITGMCKIENKDTIAEKGGVYAYFNGISSQGGTSGNHYKVKGYIDESGNFVAVDSQAIANSCPIDGNFHPVYGYIDEKGVFYADGSSITDRGGTGGRSYNIAGMVNESCKLVPLADIAEKGGFYAYYTKTDDRGGTSGKFRVNRYDADGYVDEYGDFILLPKGLSLTACANRTKMRKLSGYIDQSGIFHSSGSNVSENGGARGKGYAVSGIIDSSCRMVTKSEIKENGGFYAYYSQTDERSGTTSKFNAGQNKYLTGLKMNDNCSEVNIGESGCSTLKVAASNITYADDFWIDIPADPTAGIQERQNRAAVENMFADMNNSFCIQSVKPYDTMSPENVYRLRASVVSVENPKGRKGAGLIISDQLILTSADLIDKSLNSFDIRTINGMHFKGSAYRVNPNKNVALILLSEKTKFAPLPLRLDLPEVGKDLYMTLGLLDFDEGENYLDNGGQVIGYRYSEEKGAEIIVNTYVQTQTLGSALIDKNGNITGLSHSGIRAAEGGDLFIPIETALKSLGMNICGVKFVNKRPMAVKAVEKPVSTAIDTYTGSKAPKAMSAKERK